MTEQPKLVWGVIASMWVGNLMLLVINLPLIGLWVSIVGLALLSRAAYLISREPEYR